MFTLSNSEISEEKKVGTTFNDFILGTQLIPGYKLYIKM